MSDEYEKEIEALKARLEEANRHREDCAFNHSNIAMEEALVHIKMYRERAEKAEKLADERELARLKALAGQGLAEEKLIGEQNKHKRTKDKLKREKEQNRKLREMIVELQTEMKAPEPQKTEVMAFIDDCGHQVVVNLTGTAQKLKVYRELIEDAMKQGVLSNNEHYNYDELLKTGSVEELQMAISDSYISTGGCSREGFDPITALNEWPGADLDG